ncbi:receptor-type tyrosine-protein phosphatase N2-like [Tubulanus polymorphus]|uniref:receptor-type tyrosine-protein phosphatase N2-like n=1 Tax=Tubulanus polymorphus TaxID=672921 RepID=UPI003DA5834D
MLEIFNEFLQSVENTITGGAGKQSSSTPLSRRNLHRSVSEPTQCNTIGVSITNANAAVANNNNNNGGVTAAKTEFAKRTRRRYSSLSKSTATPRRFSSNCEDNFVHVKEWYRFFHVNPCSKTEIIRLNYCRSEEPVVSNMDITTGHIVLSYMEDHLKNKDRLEREWEELSNYIPEPSATEVGNSQQNARKNRYSDILPYDHSRVVLNTTTNVLGSDFINANTITDHDPRNPAYIATQGPLPHTVADFWQMIWEQGSVVIVMLTKLTETGVAMCHRYWPEEGSDLYHIYEVHLVSEHIWCDDYLVRSFYLKNLQTNETRTVTQFHFLTWSDLGIPSSAKALLDFRRKVNKSYRGRSCPIVVHCSDGSGRSGTYCLIDMVLNRMSKGAKEIDISATLEHIRDQRMTMVKTKEQFEFALASVAEEVHAILKALPQ